MNFEQIFIFFLMVPFMLGSIFFAAVQRKFLNRYHEVFHPTDPVSLADVIQLLDKDPKRANKFLKKNFINLVFFGWKIYLKKYNDSQLKRLALGIKLIFIALLLIVFISPIIILFLFN